MNAADKIEARNASIRAAIAQNAPKIDRDRIIAKAVKSVEARRASILAAIA